ncbi:RNA-binding domain-containing protein [Paenisporosarcina sp. TG20]|uniref:RNA-binding domain-containing protein n=1 Tax=Paenisporosarcina sp. TG20 TaxID=1211706 RepID=UPI00035C5492|nr:RNA-binding domain-containing protein [Paenisporosarcina sp. TG20]
MSIKELIANGETMFVEFKSWINVPNKRDLFEILATETVGFSNANGGIILVGVEDDGEITGCQKYDTQNVIESIYDRTVPKVFTDIEIIKIDEKDILKITVSKSVDTIATSRGTVYKRLGKNTKPLYPSEYQLNTIERIKGDFSAKILAHTTDADIDYAEVENLKQKIHSRDKDSTLHLGDNVSLLRDLHLIAVDEENIKLTVAGLLLVGKQESIIRHLPQAEIMILTYDQEGQTEYNKRIELRTSLIKSITRIQEIFEDRNSIKNIQMGLFKLEVHDYPSNVFQEALLNAIAHRSYESSSSIIIKLYPSKIIIENPGSFPDGIYSNNIITHPSTPRNKLIAETFQKLKYVQRSGQGIDIIFKDMLSLGKSAPEYKIYEDAVSLTLRSSVEDVEFLKFINREQETNGDFSVSEICILKYVKSFKTIGLSKAAEVAQISTSEATNVLNLLCNNKNILQRETRNKYMFTHRIYDSFDNNIEYTKDKEFDEIQARTMIIDYLSKNGFMTRLDVERLCGFSSTSSKRILKKLREEGTLILEGKSKASIYKLHKE